jgi:N-methylhydantoinase A
MTSAQEPVRIGIDVGGTFTDVAAVTADGRLVVLKVPSTPSNPSVAVLGGLQQMWDHLGRPAVEFLGHGTTAGTNAFLTRRGARTALLTTAGFEDVLEFRRMDRSGLLDPYDLQLQFPAPLVPSRLRFGVRERVGVGGEIVKPLTDAEIERVIGLVRDSKAEAVAISLLWSFAEPVHEQALARALAEALPDVYVTCASDIDPAMQEYERTSTTVVNAYLGPLINRYFGLVEARVAELGLPDPHIMQSNGGLSSVREAAHRAVALLESGPAAGVAACGYLGSLMGLDNILAVDMGGTSFDVALIVDGTPRRNIETEVEGYVVRVPMLDIRSIGAGGGSIAWIDEGGSLQVGPQSAGSQPGPVCYGRGGTEPTVSDANAVLGYLQSLTGGSLQLDVPAAAAALDRVVGSSLGVDALGAAAAVIRLVNAHMADAMRVIVSESAMSPSDVTLMAYGGAGPVHAAALARELDIKRTVIPHHPGALSALGAGTADVIHDLVTSMMLPLDALEPQHLLHEFGALFDRGRDILLAEGIPSNDIMLEPYVVARYIGQMHDLQVPVDVEDLSHLDTGKLAGEFHRRHHEAYGLSVEHEPVFIVSIRLRAIGRIEKQRTNRQPGDLRPVPARTVSAHFEGRRYDDVPVFVRSDDWQPQVVLPGPAIVQEYDSTIVVLPGQSWHIDAIGSTIIEED